MKISKVIRSLEKILEEVGDLNICFLKEGDTLTDACTITTIIENYDKSENFLVAHLTRLKRIE